MFSEVQATTSCNTLENFIRTIEAACSLAELKSSQFKNWPLCPDGHEDGHLRSLTCLSVIALAHSSREHTSTSICLALTSNIRGMLSFSLKKQQTS